MTENKWVTGVLNPVFGVISPLLVTGFWAHRILKFQMVTPKFHPRKTNTHLKQTPVTPPKTNMDTQNDGLEKVVPFNFGHFLVSMLNFWGVKGDSELGNHHFEIRLHSFVFSGEYL